MTIKKSGKVQAIIWDYDGTLVDTRQKNFNVTRKIIDNVLEAGWNNFSVLETIENFNSAHSEAANWREFYKQNFGFNENQIDKTGSLWTQHQLDDDTLAPPIDGVFDVITTLEKFPHGIVSQNSSTNIIQYLKEKSLLNNFKTIIGYEEVGMERQKPNPEGLLMCIEKLTSFNAGYVFYIGDHETDVRCAFNGNKELTERNASLKIVSIGALYGYNADTSIWKLQPDYYASKAEDIINIISGLEEQ